LAAELWQRTAQSFSQFTFASAGTEPTIRLIAMAATIDFNIVSSPPLFAGCLTISFAGPSATRLTGQ
jgi:hypothetical protein